MDEEFDTVIRPHPPLPLPYIRYENHFEVDPIREQIVQIQLGAVGAQDCAVEPALLQSSNVRLRPRGHSGNHGYEASDITLSSADVPMIKPINLHRICGGHATMMDER
jgi:hypothetical protein